MYGPKQGKNAASQPRIAYQPPFNGKSHA